MSVTVRDDGKGFDLAQASGRGLGLIGMEERIKKLGGTLSISSKQNGGTVLKVELPNVAEA